MYTLRFKRKNLEQPKKSPVVSTQPLATFDHEREIYADIERAERIFSGSRQWRKKKEKATGSLN